MIKICKIVILILLFSCQQKRKPLSFYDEKYFRKVRIIGSKATNEEYDVFINTMDTSRKMLKYYWGNGYLQAVSFYYKGKKDGKWVQYYEEGNIAFEGNYVNGEKNGLQKSYFPNGQLSSSENYISGEKAGVWFYYDTLGNVITTKKY